ncbi:adenosylhomocysteinase [Calderihabitans maritimus]|uniref:Adenosylhomocysteinase n=1 Tax=Calderihabitans maritimus TaxID=1246530 RepID=A0A1Z5HXM9_9FIRM|nr:adenosylhomocysteinase [Calderihabitans maritimus]GAW94264.1 adenosylhomocysteinase [Calderihabitans maritimus]
MLNESMIRDIKLAPQGRLKIEWVENHMPVLSLLKKQFISEKPFAGKRIAVCLHLEAKTAYLAKVLQSGGAEVAVTASNPLSTQDDVVAALVEEGIRAYAWYGASPEEYEAHLNKVLDFQPDLIIDDGGDLVALLHRTRQTEAGKVIGGCEETTTGVLRLKALEREKKLLFPMVAVNDALSKYLFDNRYGTGQSVWDGINRSTNLVVAGKNVVVVGYGWCGKGVALRAKGLGAKVIVCEIDPIRANEALMDGYQVMPLAEAAPLGDFFITVTGNRDVIRKEHFALMKDQAILANAGHFDVEISKTDLAQYAVGRRKVRQNVEEFRLPDGRRIYLLAEGRLVNLAAGDGHPAEIMDLSFALQAYSLLFILENREKLEAKLYRVPDSIDRKVARLRLEALGIKIDTLTLEQETYLKTWQLDN